MANTHPPPPHQPSPTPTTPRLAHCVSMSQTVYPNNRQQHCLAGVPEFAVDLGILSPSLGIQRSQRPLMSDWHTSPSCGPLTPGTILWSRRAPDTAGPFENPGVRDHGRATRSTVDYSAPYRLHQQKHLSRFALHRLTNPMCFVGQDDTGPWLCVASYTVGPPQGWSKKKTRITYLQPRKLHYAKTQTLKIALSRPYTMPKACYFSSLET